MMKEEKQGLKNVFELLKSEYEKQNKWPKYEDVEEKMLNAYDGKLIKRYQGKSLILFKSHFGRGEDGRNVCALVDFETGEFFYNNGEIMIDNYEETEMDQFDNFYREFVDCPREIHHLIKYSTRYCLDEDIGEALELLREKEEEEEEDIEEQEADDEAESSSSEDESESDQSDQEEDDDDDHESEGEGEEQKENTNKNTNKASEEGEDAKQKQSKKNKKVDRDDDDTTNKKKKKIRT